MTIVLTLLRVGPTPDVVNTLGQITTNSTNYLPSNFVIVDHPGNGPGDYVYSLIAASPDTNGDSIIFNNMNMALLHLKK